MPIYDLKAINEAVHAKEISACNNEAIVFYTHCLKWMYQPTKQSTSWIKSIMNSSSDIKKLAFNDKGYKIANICNNIDLKNAYIAGIKLASKEVRFDIKDDNGYIFSTFHSLETIEKYSNIDSIGIIDKNRIKEWLILHAYNESKINMVERYGG